MAALMEPFSPLLNPIVPSNSNPCRRNLRVSKKPSTLLLRLHSPATTTYPPCCAASPPTPNPPPLPGDEESAPDLSRDRRRAVCLVWEKLVCWSRSSRFNAKTDVLEKTNKVVVLGGGSFDTAMAAHVAGRKPELEVHMLVRDPQVCQFINENPCNCIYFPKHKLPQNVVATSDAKAALLGADYCLHAVPVQFSSSFLAGIADHTDPGLPFISLGKGLELNTLRMMSLIIPHALKNQCQPFFALPGPSFALELMNKMPTGAHRIRCLIFSIVESNASKPSNFMEIFLPKTFIKPRSISNDSLVYLKVGEAHINENVSLSFFSFLF